MMDIKHGISMVSYIVLEDRLLCMPMVTKIGTFMAYNIEKTDRLSRQVTDIVSGGSMERN